MPLRSFQRPQATQSSFPEQPKYGAKSMEPAHWRIDDQKSLEAAVSEGWPVPPSNAPLTNTASAVPDRVTNLDAAKDHQSPVVTLIPAATRRIPRHRSPGRAEST